MANDWLTFSLGELTDWASGGTPPKENPEYWGGDIPWISASSMKSGRLSESDRTLTQKGLEQKSRLARKNDVLLLVRGSELHKRIPVGVATRDVAFNQDVKALRAKNGISSTYLYYWLAAHEPMLLSKVEHTGIGAGKLDTAVLKALPVEFPPADEQRAIAHILGTLDDKIELNRRANETLEAMARTLFKAWFVDFEPVRAKIEGRWPRDRANHDSHLPGMPAHLYDIFPDRLVDSELGEIPEGWEIAALGDYVETVKGRSYKSEELAESTTALVTLKSFARGGGYRIDGLKSFTGKYKQEQVIEPGEVVVACTDVTQAAELIGRAAIVRRTRRYQTLVASLDTMIVRPISDRVTRAFLYHLGRSESFVAHTYSHTTGTTVLHLGKEAIPTYRFVLPPQDLVRHFDVAASNSLARIDDLEDESERLVALRDTLLPKLISGELRIKDAEAFLKERNL